MLLYQKLPGNGTEELILSEEVRFKNESVVVVIMPCVMTMSWYFQNSA